MIRVVVADKNETLRLGLRSLFDQYHAKFKVSEAADRAGLINRLRNDDCHLVIMEPLLCAGGGEALIRQIKRESPGSKVLIYTELDERTFGARAIRCGARGYVMKSSPASELLTAVERVGAGRLHMSEALAEEIALSIADDRGDAPHETLSERERTVFAMLVCGRKVKEIASALNLSSKTVSTHKTRAMVKLRCKSFSELVQYAMSKGLKDDCEMVCKGW